MKKLTWVLKVTSLPAIFILAFWINNAGFNLTPENIRGWILSFGWVAPFLFLLLYTVRPLFLFPASVLSLTGGLAFGALWGTVLTVIGATAGAILSFGVARYLGKGLFRKEWQGRMKKVEQQLAGQGIYYVLLLRLVPLFPFDLISYAAGLSKVGFRAFVFGTLFGIIPGSFAYNFLGSSFVASKPQDILPAAALFLVVLLVPVVFKKRLAGDKSENI